MIELQRVTLRAGDFRLPEIDLAVPDQAFGVLMGRTGSGKTTLLETICGLRNCMAGRILLSGEDVTSQPPSMRRIGYVPQDAVLFETMTVQQHLAFGPRIHGWSRQEIRRRVDELASRLEIRSLLSRRPVGLSGGERQRVALGRALAARPAILLMDEPLSAVDEATREDLCDLLLRVREESRVTALHVTHSVSEAARLADPLFELVEGKILPRGSSGQGGT